jgi:hypothetical protein
MHRGVQQGQRVGAASAEYQRTACRPLSDLVEQADEHVTIAFEQQGSSTEVRVTGKLRDRAYAEVNEAFGAG